jgi:hypothetical protein
MEAKMEIKKNSSIATIVQAEESAKNEKPSTKSNSSRITSTKDSFEVATNTNGGLFSHQAEENSGKKELTPSEQQQASSMDYKDFLNLKNSSTQDNRSKYEDAKNSGLSKGLGQGKSPVDEETQERIKGRTADSMKDLNSPMGSEQTNDAIRQLTDGQSMRDFIKEEVAERHQEFDKLGNGTALERLAKSLDPSSNQGNSKPIGKDQIAYDRDTERKNKDGSTTKTHDGVYTLDGNTHVVHSEVTNGGPTGFTIERKETIYNKDNSKVEKETKQEGWGRPKKTTETTTTTKEDGTVTTSTTTTTTNKDGSTTTTTTEKTTPPGGGTKSYDPENYKGNIPEVIQRTMDHFKEQAKKLRPEGGGERVLTDGGASGTPVVGHDSDVKISPKFGGITGMVGQPDQTTEEVGHSNSLDGGSNADLNGGATDVDGNNWTGRTIKDDPTNVHFGPAEQPKKQDKDEESSKSSKSFSNQFRHMRA